MSFFDFTIYLAIGSAFVAIGIGICSALRGRVEYAYAEDDCRDTALIRHGEGRRDCK